MADFDAIVVGAGPGGSAAAYFLAKAGARVAVVERKRFPRAKTCGDGLTPRAIKILDDIGLASEMAGYHRVGGLRVKGGGRTMLLDFPKIDEFCDWGLIRPRKQLDTEVVAKARAAGAEFLMETKAIEPIFSDGTVAGIRWVRNAPAHGGGIEKVDEGSIHAPFTILADGASSPFGRAMGITKRDDYPMGLAIRTYYESHMSDDAYFESWLELRKGDELLPGYGWLFPVGDGTVNVGVGLLSTFGQWRSVNLNTLQRDFIDMLPPSYGITHEGQVGKYQSGRLPMGGSVRKPYGPGYLVIGDAAGMVNPFNGEGIAYALETGKLAGGLVAEALEAGSTTELVSYREALHDIYGAYYRMGRKFTKIIGEPRLFLSLIQVGMRSKRIMNFVFQVLANLGESSGGRLGDKAFRRLTRIAEQELPDLEAPDIPSPPVKAARSVTTK